MKKINRSSYITRSTKVSRCEYMISAVYTNKLKKIYNAKLYHGSLIEYNEYPQFTRDNPLINIFKFKKD